MSSTSPPTTAVDHVEPPQSPPINSWLFPNDTPGLMSGLSTETSQNAQSLSIPDSQLGLDVDWSSWLPSHTEDLDFNSLQSLSGQIRAQAPNNQSAPSFATFPSIQVSTANGQTVSGRSASPNVRTRREIAKGMAMVTLEAAAEPHYVGESSGSFWSDVIAQGMCEPSRANRTQKRGNKRPRNRSPSPTDRHILRASLQRQLSNDVAKHILLTVYQHLHSRVSLVL
jgi:hypothetical protein